ncbi:MAG: metal-sensing transcriptional repressor [Defluviitaleaceae bacterium]|nr:metal-sensing transcriptional repressor [Defluviitaleaceae bacterium]
MECNQECSECDVVIHRSAKINKDIVIRLNRIEGQVKGVRSMINKDVYCDDVLIQISAVQAALASVAKILLDSHIRTCVIKRLQAGDEEVINELIKTIGKLYKPK